MFIELLEAKNCQTWQSILQADRSTTPDSVCAVSCETLLLAFSKTKVQISCAQISCAVKAQLISSFATYEPCSEKTSPWDF